MAPDTSTGLPQEGFWHQSNITLDPACHQHKSACYRITHLASGKVYIGWLGDAWRGLTLMASRLRAGNFPNTVLQHLVNQDCACSLEVLIADSRLCTEDIHDTLRAAMDSWIEVAGSNLIHNSAALPPRKQVGAPAWRSVQPSTGRTDKSSSQRKPYKPRATKGPWKNLHLSMSIHCGVGAFKLRHLKTGECFVGSTKNIYEALRSIRKCLANGTYSNNKLTAAYQVEPEFELSVELSSSKSKTISEQLDAADTVVNQWLQELGDKCTVVQRSRQRGGLGRAVDAQKETTSDVKFTHNGQMNQIRTKAVAGALLPARDFLHKAWFGSGV